MVIVAGLPAAPGRGTVPEENSGSLRWAKGASDDR
jgi:hypothetical protein